MSHEDPPAAPPTVERFHGLESGDSIELLLHLHRYEVARCLATGLRVLDFGAGDGYGSFLLSKVAREVVSFDRDAGEMEAARRKYQAPNISFSAGGIPDIERLPAESFDLVVCFEVIEHVREPEQDRLVAALARAVAPRGLLMASTPNAAVKERHYARFPSWRNPFHLRELTLEELEVLLERHFPSVRILPQVVEIASVVGLPESAAAALAPRAAWVNLAFAGKTVVNLPVEAPSICLPRRAHMLEDLLGEQDRVSSQLDRVSSQLDQRNVDLTRRTEELAQVVTDRNRVATDLERTVADRDRLATELGAARLEIDRLQHSLPARVSRALDRWPRLKRVVAAVGRRIFR